MDPGNVGLGNHNWGLRTTELLLLGGGCSEIFPTEMGNGPRAEQQGWILALGKGNAGLNGPQTDKSGVWSEGTQGSCSQELHLSHLGMGRIV